MCTAATYQSAGFYFGRTLDYEVSYGNQIVITPRNYALRFRHTVLHVDCCHIGVCALLEVNLNNSQTCIGGTRTDIHHVFHTVDTLFQGHDDTVHHCLGISTGIAGSHIYRRRCNIGILLHGQREE